MAQLSPEHRDEIAGRLLGAINSDQLRVNVMGAPF
jgi:hypothetical protein